MKTKNSFFILLMILIFCIKQSYAAAMARPVLTGLSRQAMMTHMAMASYQRPQALLITGRFQDNRGLTTGASPQMPAKERQEPEEQPAAHLTERGRGREQHEELHMLAAGSSELEAQGDCAHKKDGIYDYASEDEEVLLEIGMQHTARLGISRADLSGAFNDDRSTIQTKTKVYFCDGIPAGFIIYRLAPQAYKRFMPNLPIGPDAIIAYLAVHNQYQRKGIGTRLMQAAIGDLQDQSANHIKLTTTGCEVPSELHKLYSKFGFKIVRQGDGKSADTSWNKQSGPYSRYTPYPSQISAFKFYCKAIVALGIGLIATETGKPLTNKQLGSKSA